MSCKVTRLGGKLGARIEGIHFDDAFGDEKIEQIAAALFEHQVVSLGATDMSAEQHARLARRFGELEHQATD